MRKEPISGISSLRIGSQERDFSSLPLEQQRLIQRQIQKVCGRAAPVFSGYDAIAVSREDGLCLKENGESRTILAFADLIQNKSLFSTLLKIEEKWLEKSFEHQEQQGQIREQEVTGNARPISVIQQERLAGAIDALSLTRNTTSAATIAANVSGPLPQAFLPASAAINGYMAIPAGAFLAKSQHKIYKESSQIGDTEGQEMAAEIGSAGVAYSVLGAGFAGSETAATILGSSTSSAILAAKVTAIAMKIFAIGGFAVDVLNNVFGGALINLIGRIKISLSPKAAAIISKIGAVALKVLYAGGFAMFAAVTVVGVHKLKITKQFRNKMKAMLGPTPGIKNYRQTLAWMKRQVTLSELELAKIDAEVAGQTPEKREEAIQKALDKKWNVFERRTNRDALRAVLEMNDVSKLNPLEMEEIVAIVNEANFKQVAVGALLITIAVLGFAALFVSMLMTGPMASVAGHALFAVGAFLWFYIDLESCRKFFANMVWKLGKKCATLPRCDIMRDKTDAFLSADLNDFPTYSEIRSQYEKAYQQVLINQNRNFLESLPRYSQIQAASRSSSA